MRAIIEHALSAKDAKAWEPELNAAGAPCASIWRIEEILEHPQIKARGVLQTVETPFGPLSFMGSGFQMAHGGGRLDTVGPALGAHTDAVLTECGYSAAEIAAFHAAAIV